jgi:hypothetical protein
VRRGADDLRGAVGVGRAALGHAAESFQKQNVFFSEHGAFHFFDGASLAKLGWSDNPADYRTIVSGSVREITKMVSFGAGNASSRPVDEA